MTVRAACTIVASNYLAQARVCARSFRAHHPDARMFVAFIDDPSEALAPGGEPFEVVTLKDVAIPDLARMSFKYTVLEFSTAVKPFIMEHLLQREGIERLLYLDPDIEVFAPLDALFGGLDEIPISLTPHTLSPIEDAAEPSERSLLQAGVYNLGYVGVASHPRAVEMLRWWQRRCSAWCVSRPAEGLFVDQKWMDLAPAMFAPVRIETDPGLNVAYWNLHERRVTAADAPRVNGVPLKFFHFSGYSPARPDNVSKHQDRFAMDQVGEARTLFERYGARLQQEGFEDLVRRPYGRGRFTDGVAVPDVARDLYYRLPAATADHFANPFATGAGSFREWLTAPSDADPYGVPRLSNLVLHVPAFRPDIARAFGMATELDRPALLAWLHSAGHAELRIDAALLPENVRLPPPGANGERPDGECRACRLKRWLGRGPAPAPNTDPPAGSPAGPPAAPAAAQQPWPRPIRRAAQWLLRPCHRHGRLREPHPARSPVMPFVPPPAPPAAPADSDGINLVGYLSTQSGVGQAARLMSTAVEAAGIPMARINFPVTYDLPQLDPSPVALDSANPHRINLIHVNADQTTMLHEHFGPEFFAGRRNIGHWMWELPSVPASWQPAFEHYDEIWAGSQFAADAFAALSPVPVRVVPLPVPPPDPPAHDRAHFDLPADRFIVLFMFDHRSLFERKNPLAVIEAFTRASEDHPDALLLIKTSNGAKHPAAHARLLDAADDAVQILDTDLTGAEVNSLFHAVDAYCSLHRAEGYGLTIVEAMAAGLPVVATNFSGPRDFLHPDRAYPVPYRLQELERDVGPYSAGALWADPDVAAAAAALLEILGNRAAARECGTRARAWVQESLSPEAVGRRLTAAIAAGVGSAHA